MFREQSTGAATGCSSAGGCVNPPFFSWAVLQSAISWAVLRLMSQQPDVHLRQLAKKITYVRSFFGFSSSAYLGFLARGPCELQGSSKTRGKQNGYVSKKALGVLFSGGFFFHEGLFFPLDFFIALVKRLSVRGTQKRDCRLLTAHSPWAKQQDTQSTKSE
jgi:hypothetical protein